MTGCLGIQLMLDLTFGSKSGCMSLKCTFMAGKEILGLKLPTFHELKVI